MALLKSKAKARKADLEASAAAAEARRAAQDAVDAARELATALGGQVRDLGIDERAGDAVERIRSSEKVRRAQERAGEVGRLVADSDRVAKGRESAAKTTATTLAGLGTWLASGDRGQKLGIAPKRRRRVGLLWALVGVGLGYAIGVLTAPRQGSEIREQIVSRGSNGLGRHPGSRDLDGAPVFERPLADKVRTRLGEDPRTADLSGLHLNVVDGTVVVRGALPDDADTDAVRDVITGVEGVDGVDFQLDTTS